MDILKRLREVQRLRGDTYSSAEIIGMVGQAANEIERLRNALQPFADFADKAEQFVEDRAKDKGSPIMPTKDFRLADFKRARNALAETR